MPTIPTFSATASPTTTAGEVKSNFQVPITGGAAGTVLSVATKLNEYYAAKQELTDNVEAKKKFYELKGTTDQYVLQQKDNYNEENAIQSYTNNFNDYIQQELSKVNNPTVRDKVKKDLELEFGQGVYQIKKNSFDALEKQSTTIQNNEQESLSFQYQQETNPDLKQQILDKQLLSAVEYNKLHKLSPVDLINRSKAIETNAFISDFKVLAMGTDNAQQTFNQLYESKNASRFVSNQELSKILVDTYKNNISNLAVKGDENSDYDKALKMAKELESLKTPDGRKILTDKTQADWGAFKEKLLTEKVGHETLKLEASQSLEINTYIKDERDNLEGAFVNKMTASTDVANNLAREKANQAKTEYNSTVQNWLFANKDKTNAEKKQYVTDLKRNLIEKYNDNAITLENISAFDTYQKPLNIHRTFETYKNDYESWKANPNGSNYLKTEAKLRGFVDKKGNPDVRAYMNAIIPTLKQRLEQE